MPLPIDASPHAVIFLSLSGFVGFVIADMFLFSAYATVGPRIAMLFSALTPLVTAGIAFIFLGETIGAKGWIGMCLVILGILITVFARHNSISFSKINREDRRGYIFAFISCIGGALAIIFTKIGIGDYHSVSATQIRLFAALAGLALLALISRRMKTVKEAFKNSSALKFTAAGSVFGPFIGVTLSLFAIQRISTGIASTLIGMTPVVIILPEILFLKRKIKPFEILGALVAVSGTAIFFLW